MRRVDTYIGFDSAWTDNTGSPGAICAVARVGGKEIRFVAPELVSFQGALGIVRELHGASDFSLLALDQPTIVPNAAGIRPVERVAGSVVGWIGGGVQPANRARLGMFCDAAPIWLFLKGLSAVERPEEARLASSGMHLIEVFPALALPSIEPEFYQRLAAPKYNPDNRRFRLEDWVRVARAAQAGFDLLNISAASCWCAAAAAIRRPVKADQDKLDAMLCLLIALHWRLQPRERSIMLGDVVAGYMVAPVSPVVRERLVGAARRLGIFAG